MDLNNISSFAETSKLNSALKNENLANLKLIAKWTATVDA